MEAIREGNRATGETRGAREFRGLCSWIVKIAEASERCSVPASFWVKSPAAKTGV